jgi:hypothetical protein
VKPIPIEKRNTEVKFVIGNVKEETNMILIKKIVREDTFQNDE